MQPGERKPIQFTWAELEQWKRLSEMPHTPSTTTSVQMMVTVKTARHRFRLKYRKQFRKLFAPQKTLIRRRYECLKTTCPALYDSVSFCKHINTNQGRRSSLQNASLRLDTQAEHALLAIEDPNAVPDCENFTASKMDMDNTKNKPALVHFSNRSSKEPRRQRYCRKKPMLKVATFLLRKEEHTSRTSASQLPTSAGITLIMRRTCRKLGFLPLETCNIPVKTADHR
ncbi:hypothetical protein COOONC_28115 [Cooperia oncophora]